LKGKTATGFPVSEHRYSVFCEFEQSAAAGLDD